MTSWGFCPHPECRERDLHGHGTDQKYLPNLPSEESAMAENNPYVQGPPVPRGRCSETRPHAPHIERDEGDEFLCDIEPHVAITKAELPPLKPVRDHRGFGFTFWEEIPWKEGCTTCDEIRADPQQRVGPVIDHWAAVGVPLSEQQPGESDIEYRARIGKDASPTKQREGDQRLPDGDESQPDDFTAYIDDIAARRAVGIERYGQAHRPFNGRDTLLDAYEEVLDTGLYLRSLLTQAKADREELVRVVTLALESLGIQGDYEKSGAELAAEVAVDRIMGWVVAQRGEILSLMAEAEKIMIPISALDGVEISGHDGDTGERLAKEFEARRERGRCEEIFSVRDEGVLRCTRPNGHDGAHHFPDGAWSSRNRAVRRTSE